MNTIKTKHNLDFLVKESKEYGLLYKIGTCHGIWGFTDDFYYILSVINEKPGNGHLEDVFEWFYNSCNREGVNLVMLECHNQDFYKYLIDKKEFKALDDSNVIKVFNKKLYKKTVNKGIENYEFYENS